MGKPSVRELDSGYWVPLKSVEGKTVGWLCKFCGRLWEDCPRRVEEEQS